jgi:hypothetical protein
MPKLVAMYGAALILDGAANIYRLPLMAAVVQGALGYPPYFLTIVGLAKISAGLAFVLPLPRKIKEAAVLGVLFEHLGALASHLLSPIIAPGGPVPILLALVLWAAVCRHASQSTGSPDGWFAMGLEQGPARNRPPAAEATPSA